MSETKRAIVFYKPEECGWVRASKLDRPGGWAWEAPDGKLYLLQPGQQIGRAQGEAVLRLTVSKGGK